MGLFGLFEKDVVYFPGTYSLAYLKPVVNNYKKILKELGIKFSLIEDIESGGFLIEGGYDKQARKIAKSNFEYFNSQGVKKIIVSDPFCFKTFKLEYPEMLPNWDIEVEFITDTILKALEQSKKEPSSFFNEPIFYYDSCYLSRYLNFTDSPRKLLEKIGVRILDNLGNPEDILCCGSCGNLPIYDNNLANKIALLFISPIKEKQVKKFLTSDARAYRHLVLNKLNSNDSEKWPEIIEFSEVLCDSLGIKKEAPIDLEELEKEILNNNQY
ncbi:(Fe-S)-binding protein [Candidatus Pacearchaeota archaeon]|nr:(Fe-S)-binding protein [Candidatus Pacearchaeota archaeon]